MPVTGPNLTERDLQHRQIDTLVASGILHGSESLCKLLRYLAEQAEAHPGVLVKEYQIATEVFGRPSYFDPRLDSTVRVQTGRLRSKLAEYYSAAGLEDPVLVDIPKGSYSLMFHSRASVPPVVPPEPALPNLSTVAPPPATPPELRPRSLTVAVIALSLALLASVSALCYLIATRQPAPAKPLVKQEDLGPHRVFWKDFIDRPEFPWVVFSNAEFTGRPETGLRYFNPATDSRESIFDHYTGVGEVLAIHELDRVFALLNHGLRVKRGRLLSLDDAKHNDVIFVGSPSENLSLLEIPTSREFIFRRSDLAKRKGDLSIVNVHPRSNEEKTYFATVSGVQPTEDFAVISLAPGLTPTHMVMLLAGITTMGTQASVEYVTKGKNLEDLLVRLTGSKNGAVMPFDALLRVKISRGVPVATQLVALHPR